MIRKLFTNFEEIIGSLLLVAICLIATLQVASRYIFSRPFSWTEELGTYLFVYLAFVGASLALKKNEHFAVEILLDKFPLKIRSWMLIVIGLLVLLCSGIIFWYGCRLMIHGLHVKTPALEISSAIPYAAVPFGGFLMMIRTVEMIIREIQKKFPRRIHE